MSSTLTKIPFILENMAADTANRLREVRKRLRLTQEEMAQSLGAKRTAYANWELGIAEPSLDVLEQFERLYGDPGMIIRERRTGYNKNLKGEPSGKVKIYGAGSAGDGSVSTPDLDELDVPLQFARDDYGALIVEGRSMEPFLEHGDIAIFRDWQDAKPGYVMALSTENGEWLIKEVISPTSIRALNPDFPQIDGRFRFSGFLVGIVRDAGPERTIRLNPYGLKSS